MPHPKPLGPSDMDLVEAGLIRFWQEVKAQCPNSHQAYRELALAMEAFEDGFIRLRRAIRPPNVQWPVRHG